MTRGGDQGWFLPGVWLRQTSIVHTTCCQITSEGGTWCTNKDIKGKFFLCCIYSNIQTIIYHRLLSFKSWVQHLVLHDPKTLFGKYWPLARVRDWVNFYIRADMDLDFAPPSKVGLLEHPKTVLLTLGEVVQHILLHLKLCPARVSHLLALKAWVQM